MLVALSDGGVSVLDLLASVYGGGALGLAWLITLAITKFRSKHVPLRVVLVAPILLALGGFAFVSDSAFFLRFYPSRAALDRYVSQVRGHPLDHRPPHRVGLFVAY